MFDRKKTNQFRYQAATSAPRARKPAAAKKAAKKRATKKAAPKAKKAAVKKATKKAPARKTAPKKRATTKRAPAASRVRPPVDLASYGRSKSGKRLSISETLRLARDNASARTNQRLGIRKSQMSKHATIHGHAAVVEGVHELSVPSRIWRWIFAILLVPVCVVATMTLAQGIAQTQVTSNIFQSATFHLFVFGIFSMTCCFWFCQKYSEESPAIEWCERQLLLAYVLGHELTHALFIYLSLGWVSGFNVSRNGGYVITNKSNLMIALSPYFVPFWSLVCLSITMAINYFWAIPHYSTLMTVALGITWTFHLYWTVWMIPRDQPDLQENGTFLSLVIIYLANIIILSVMVSWASAKITSRTFIEGWQQNGEAVLSGLYNWINLSLLS